LTRQVQQGGTPCAANLSPLPTLPLSSLDLLRAGFCTAFGSIGFMGRNRKAIREKLLHLALEAQAFFYKSRY
jgi:hypothetical protein